jgi:glycine/D-amino acid oxidase-like deaminating enzyme
VDQHLNAALGDANPVPFWLDDPHRPAVLPPLRGSAHADLVVVGGGFTGLWAALQAKEDDPSRRVVLLEGARVAWAASGRNGGFVAASLTHGLPNGVERFPGEIATLQRLAAENLAGIVDSVDRYGIDCNLEATGELTVATEDWQVADLEQHAQLMREHGADADFLDAEQVRKEVDSPTYLAGLWDRTGVVMVNPARLAWGLLHACLSSGVEVFERSPVRAIASEGPRLVVRTDRGDVRTDAVITATSAFRSPVRRFRPFVIPVYDYVLVTEPLSAEQKGAIGWESRQGLADSANQFHYYRLTEDDRILWGGYEAVYNFGGRVSSAHDQRPETFELLAKQFFDTFPQLEGLRFTHSWGGAIDTCSRFSMFFGRAYGGRLAHVAGFTGLGVGASRFGARVALDLVSGAPTELTELEMVRTLPLPFPPEPIRYPGVQLTRWSLDRADRDNGRRNIWLRGLDRLGLGFDS